MSQRFVISDHVIETIKALPTEEREAVSRALALELFAGGNPEEILTPFQAMLYSVIRYHVKRDTERAKGGLFSQRPDGLFSMASL